MFLKKSKSSVLICIFIFCIVAIFLSCDEKKHTQINRVNSNLKNDIPSSIDFTFPELPSEKDTVIITISGWPGNLYEESGIQTIVKKFNSIYDDIKIKWDVLPGDYYLGLKTRLSSGTAADLFYLDSSLFEEYAKNNYLLALDRYIKQSDFPINDFYNKLIEIFQYDDIQYGIPKDFSTLALWYNKEIFNKYDISYPTNEMSWEDLRKKAIELKKAGFNIPLIIIPELNRIIPIILAFGGKIIDDELNICLDNPSSKKALNFFMDLHLKDKILYDIKSIGTASINYALGKELTAMTITGPWLIGFMKGFSSEVLSKLDTVEMPSGKAGKSTMIYTVCWSINESTPHKEEAWKVLQFLVGEGQQIFIEKAGVLSSRKSFAKNDRLKIKESFYKGIEYGFPWKIKTKSGVFFKARDAINIRLNDVFFGKRNLTEVLNEISLLYDDWTTQP